MGCWSFENDSIDSRIMEKCKHHVIESVKGGQNDLKVERSRIGAERSRDFSAASAITRVLPMTFLNFKKDSFIEPSPPLPHTPALSQRWPYFFKQIFSLKVTKGHFVQTVKPLH